MRKKQLYHEITKSRKNENTKIKINFVLLNFRVFVVETNYS
jgi:hypothetical protein